MSKMLRPLVRILIRYGLSYPEFSEVMKQLYVDVANKDYSIEARKQTDSRIAILTGLCRKEVHKIKNNLENEFNTYKAPINRANRVILGWLKDSEFLSLQNKPMIIPLRGESGSFEVLVKRYSGDITSRAILDELIRIGAVEKVNNNELQLITEGYIPKTEEEKINVMAKCVRDQIKTIDFNLSHPPYEARFQRQIRFVDLPEELIKEFKEYSKERSIEFVMELNIWLKNKKENLDIDAHKVKLLKAGFGLYYFEEENEAED